MRLIAILPLLSVLTLSVQSPQRRPVRVSVDSVSCRNDLSRVYCKIIGLPHTSERIDKATLVVNGATLSATDIDGVDFKRYFQWEDDGIIRLEIDFPPIDKAVGTLTLTMLQGDVSTDL